MVQRRLTDCEQRILADLRQAGFQVGDTFLAQDLYPARTSADSAARRTLARLADAGVLGRSGPAWATNSYQVLEGTLRTLPGPELRRDVQDLDEGWSY